MAVLPCKQNVGRGLEVVWGYLGAVIGAGFASGQEIVQFFVAYGAVGMRGVILAGVLFAFFGSQVLAMGRYWQTGGYQAILAQLFGSRLGSIVDSLLSLFLFLGICTMFSASGAIFYEHLYLPAPVGILSAYAAVILLLLKDHQGLVSSYNLLVPVKILLLLSVAIYAVCSQESLYVGLVPELVTVPNKELWPLASLLYVAYNFSLAMVILAEYNEPSYRRTATLGALTGGLLLGLMALIMYQALLINMPEVMHYEVPMLYVAGRIGKGLKMIYLIVLWLGILTTALANTYGFAKRLASFSGLRYFSCLFLTATLAVPLAFQSFTRLVGIVYPLFGILGLAILLALGRKFMQETLARF